jgi:hypothetical protein
MTFAVGDRVWYVIAGLGNVPPIWVAAVVDKVTSTRVGIKTAPRRRARYVSPARLSTDAPPADVTTIVFPPVLVTASSRADITRGKVTDAR